MTKNKMLNTTDIQEYLNKEVPFGYNGLGKLVYFRTYSRIKDNGRNEKWYETILRCVNGIYEILEEHIKLNKIDMNNIPILSKDHQLKIYDYMFNMKFLGAGRTLWSLNTKIISEKKLYTALNNCAFVSTKDIDVELTKPFVFFMDVSMLGCGVGFDVRGEGKIIIHEPISDNINKYTIEDSREGWTKSLELFLRSYFIPNQNVIEFDYSKIRKKGEKLKVFGGYSSGPQPLIDLYDFLRKRFKSEYNKPISQTLIVDIMNNISKVVVSGNIRRSSSISLGSMNYDFMNLKNYEINPNRVEYGWASNNSILGKIGMSYDEISKSIQYNGEPGILWLENVQKYGRISNNIQDIMKDDAIGINPCGEQPLENYELCNLVEIFINNINSLDEFLEIAKYAYYFGKIVSLGESHFPETSKVQRKNRRIGISISGISQFLSRNDDIISQNNSNSQNIISNNVNDNQCNTRYDKNVEILKIWCDTCYNHIRSLDREFSKILNVSESVRLTTVKPSGTISLLSGATPGIHFPFARYYIRRVRVDKDSSIVKFAKESGYQVEDDFYCKTASVISIPVHIDCDKTVKNTSIYDKIKLAEIIQRYWSDNSVSVTVEFQPHESHLLPQILSEYQHKLKSITFLPTSDSHYVQMPYEEITEEQYNLMKSKITSMDITSGNENEVEYEIGCTADGCSV